MNSTLLVFISTCISYAIVYAWNSGIAFYYMLPHNIMPVELIDVILPLLAILSIVGKIYHVGSLIYMSAVTTQPSLKNRIYLISILLLIYLAFILSSRDTSLFKITIIAGAIVILLTASVQFLMPILAHKDKGIINKLKTQDSIDNAAADAGHSPATNIANIAGKLFMFIPILVIIIPLIFILGVQHVATKKSYYFLDEALTRIILIQNQEKVITALYNNKCNEILYPVQIITISDKLKIYQSNIRRTPAIFPSFNLK